MPPVFRSAGNDSNVAGASQFVAIPSLSGLKEFDICLAFLNLVGNADPTVVVAVTPPPGWTQLLRVQNNDTQLVVFWKYASPPEPPNWVWAIGSSDQHTGVAIAYQNVDLFVPVDATSIQRNPSSVNQPIAALVTSAPNTMLVVGIGTPATVAVTPPAGFSQRAIRSQAACQVQIAEHLQSFAGSVSGLQDTLGGAQTGVVAMVALRPSAGLHGLDEVREGLIDLLPPGSRDWMDLDPGGDWFIFYEAEAAALKKWAYDLSDTLRAELDPSGAFQKVPDWENALRLIRTRTALVGSLPARRAQVVSRLRESGASTRPNLRSIVGPLLGYADPTQVTILEVARAALATANTYSDLVGGAIPGPGTFTTHVNTFDDGAGVSRAGVQLTLDLTTTHLEQISVVVTGPPPVHNLANPGPVQHGTATFTAGSAEVVGIGTFFRSIFAPGMQISPTVGSTWLTIKSIQDDTHLILAANSPSSGTTVFYSRLAQAVLTWAAPIPGQPSGALIGKILLYANAGTPAVGNPVACQLLGQWTIAVSSSAAAGTVNSAALFVEGVGRDSAGNDGLGAEIFDWGVLIDRSLEGVVNPSDHDGVKAAMARFAQAHSLGNQSLIQISTIAGGVGAVPDDTYAIPDACIPA